MRLWVTRPEPDGSEFARALGDLGHETIVEPLLQAEAVPFDDAGLVRVIGASDAIIATSRNAIRALDGSRAGAALSDALIVAVGPGTTEAAAACGAGDVLNVDGRVEDVVAQLPGVLPSVFGVRGGSGAPQVVYLRGADVTVDLIGALQRVAPDWQLREEVVYRMSQTSAPSPFLRDRLARQEIDAVTLFSSRTADAYVAALARESLVGAMRPKMHYCLSDRIAERLAVLALRRIAVATRPNVQEMLELIGGPAAQSMH